MRDVAALEREVLHAGDLDVVDVRAASLDQARILAALDALPTSFGSTGDVAMAYLFAFAACWMALTMCW